MPNQPIAITGMAVLLPGAPDLESYWRNLVEGVDAITDVPEQRWDAEFYDPDAGPDRPDRVYCKRGGFVDEFAEVDPTSFGIMPASVAGAEPDQLIALRVAAAAIADSGGQERFPAPERVGVVVGRGGYVTPGVARFGQRVRTASQLVHTLRELLPELDAEQLERVRTAFTEQLGPHQPESSIGLVPNLTASRIANRLDLRGPAYTIDAACASSLVAVDQAVAELASGRCDVMLAGGVHHCHDITMWSVFAQLGALSRSQRIRPFDRNADGILMGEGTGMVVLKRLADAEQAGDRVYAVIRGTGVASDGKSASLFNPEPGGQALAVRRAWQAAGLDPAAPDSLGLLEAHGTATPAGDGAELTTLREVFGAGEPAVIGSVKSMIGHTMPAAGIASLVKAALAIHRAVLLPTLHCDDPRPELERTRFRPIATAQVWEGDGPRRAGVNAFGFGGINAHVVLEQAPSSPVPVPTGLAVHEPEQVLRFAAADAGELAGLLAADDATVRTAGLAETHPAGAGVRLGLVDPTVKRLALARRVVAKGESWRGRSDLWFTPKPLLASENAGGLAFVFPGLESDFTPRVDDLTARFGRPDATYSARNVGRHGVGVFELGRLLDHSLRTLGITPDAMAGHSVGEWTAMACSGLQSGEAVDEFLDTFDPDALPASGFVFASIGAGVADVEPALADWPGVVLSHDNAPHQTVVCGPEQSIDELVRWFRSRRVLCQVLPFRSGFHTPMLAPHIDTIRQAAERFELHPPAVPVWSATTARPFPAEPHEVRELFVRHLLEPVRFRSMVTAMYDAGTRVFLSVGTGQLASVVDDILAGREHLAMPANVPQRAGLAQLLRVATALWVEGAEPDFAALRPAKPASASAAAAVKPRLPVRLDLGGALVRLGDRAPALGLAPRADELAALEGHPVAAELAGLLRETASTAVAVLATRTAPPPAPPPASPSLRVSTETMPYLLDHCFFWQRAGWPDIADRFPVVPATTIVQHLLDAAERTGPGARAVAVHRARFDRWVEAEPASTVELSLSMPSIQEDLVETAFGPYARAGVELAPAYPPQAPRPWPVDRTAERAPARLTADRLYTDRWMFHGPLFQGVAEISALSGTHIRGVLRTPPAPGALLDNVGQLLGCWVEETQTSRKMVFPARIERLRFFGPHPPPGARLDCTVRIVSVSDTEFVADAQLVRDGRVWAQIEGWADRRFDTHPETEAAERFPELHPLSATQPGDWTLVHERWPDLASRELLMRQHLGTAERAAYEQGSPRHRRHRLLGRIAVKDAVRGLLWQAGAGPIFPAEVQVSNDDAGRPSVRGLHGLDVDGVVVSLAHAAEAGVAIARRGGRVGIDIEVVADRPDSTHRIALSSGESELLARLAAETGEPETLWFTRVWTAKEAVAKAEGTGLAGDPKRFEVVAAAPDGLTVDVRRGEPAARRYEVSCLETKSPPDLPERHYVVAWTTSEDA